MDDKDNVTQAGVGVNGQQPNSERIDPLFNSAFIRIFGREDSKGFVRGFVNLVLEKAGVEPIGEIESIDSEHTLAEGSVGCKAPRVDVRIVSVGRIVDLEAQLYPVDIESKSMLYASELMAENVARGGNSYAGMPQIVVVMLLRGRQRFPGRSGFINVSEMRWRDTDGHDLGAGSDRMAFVLVELDKVRRRYNRLTPEVLEDELLSWLYLLAGGYENDAEVQEMAICFPTIEEFAEKYGLAANDPKVKRAYKDALSAEREAESRERYLRMLEDEARKKGHREGCEEGRIEGLEQGLLNDAKSIMDTLKLSAQEALDALKVADEDQPRYLAQLL